MELHVQEAGYRIATRPADERDVGLVVEWLREQGAIDYSHAANTLANVAYNRGWGEDHPNEMLKVAKVIVDDALGLPPVSSSQENP